MGGIRAAGSMLDVACGGGRNMRAALAAGYSVTGIDKNLNGVADIAGLPNVELIEADLETGARPVFSSRQFDGVLVTNYLWRPILPDIVAAVAPGGLLIYETFALGNERFGKPSNPDFLLKPGELIEATRARLTPVSFESVTVTGPAIKIVQRIAAVGPEHPWRSSPPSLG